MTVKARFDGRVFVPESPVNLPVGYTLEIAIPMQSAAQSQALPKPPLLELVQLLDELPANPNLPADFAAQHDHYLSGTPKRP